MSRPCTLYSFTNRCKIYQRYILFENILTENDEEQSSTLWEKNGRHPCTFEPNRCYYGCWIANVSLSSSFTLGTRHITVDLIRCNEQKARGLCAARASLCESCGLLTQMNLLLSLSWLRFFWDFVSNGVEQFFHIDIFLGRCLKIQ